MKTLNLSLKKQWFEMTKSGVKTEDYRELTEYWYKRLVFSGLVRIDKENNTWKVIQVYSFKPFSNNKMTLGYPKSNDKERILTLEHKGIEIREGNPDWGAEPGKLYFVIKHGEITERENIK